MGGTKERESNDASSRKSAKKLMKKGERSLKRRRQSEKFPRNAKGLLKRILNQVDKPEPQLF